MAFQISACAMPTELQKNVDDIFIRMSYFADSRKAFKVYVHSEGILLVLRYHFPSKLKKSMLEFMQVTYNNCNNNVITGNWYSSLGVSIIYQNTYPML